MSLKQRTVKFQPRIKLSHNIVYTKQKLTFILRRETSGFKVLSFFSSSTSVILILMCNIVVSSSPVVCGFSSFWLTIFGERRSFTVLQYHFICTLPSNTVNEVPLGFFLKVFLEIFFKLFGISFHIFAPTRKNTFFCISSLNFFG